MNREEWLTAGVKRLEERVFRQLKVCMPEKWAVSCGWSKGASVKAIGVCVDPICSKDGTTHMFIIPTQDNGLKVLGILVHEMVHAIVGIDEGHKGKFKDMCLALEMSQPMTKSGPVEGTATWEACEAVLEELGPYPHAAMVPRKRPTKPSPWVRWRSKTQHDYTVLINTKKVAIYGRPRDFNGKEMEPCDPNKVFGVIPDPRQELLPGTG